MMKTSFLPESVNIVEVGPRDGLQNEAGVITTAEKVRFIELLSASGLRDIEITSFVHPKAVPQLADAMDVVLGTEQFFNDAKPPCGSVLVPNEKGLDRALEAGVKRIAVFTAASSAFTQKNIRMTVDESITAFTPVIERALAAGITVRGYVSTVVVCPYAGRIEPHVVFDVSQRLFDLGVDEVSLGDTIGAAVPTDIERLLSVFQAKDCSILAKLAFHGHDTYGTALANVMKALEMGMTTFDSSAGGLGGCPYAPGASGNVATEELVYLFEAMGVKTGVDLEALAKASLYMEEVLGRALPSKQLQRLKTANSQNVCPR